MLPYNQTKMQIGKLLANLNSRYPSNIGTKLVFYCFSGFEGLVIRKCFVLNLMLPWQPNNMDTGHKTDKLCRQSSNDHNYQIRFTTLHQLQRKCNLTNFPIISLREFFRCHGNQTKADHHNFSYFE